MYYPLNSTHVGLHEFILIVATLTVQLTRQQKSVLQCNAFDLQSTRLIRASFHCTDLLFTLQIRLLHGRIRIAAGTIWTTG